MSRSPAHSTIPQLPALGARLRRLRRIRGLKQSDVAARAGVDQATVSRWERGDLEIEAGLGARLLSDLSGATGRLSDGPLKHLIETSSLPMHLVTDCDHRLLVASRAREREWRRDSRELLGQSLWRYATHGIRAAEGRLAALGWWTEQAPKPIALKTESGNSGLSIRPGRLVWERLYLADGTPVRLCSGDTGQ